MTKARECKERALYSRSASEAAFKPASLKGAANPFMPMIEMRAVRDLKPNARNARDEAKLVRSITSPSPFSALITGS